MIKDMFLCMALHREQVRTLPHTTMSYNFLLKFEKFTKNDLNWSIFVPEKYSCFNWARILTEMIRLLGTLSNIFFSDTSPKNNQLKELKGKFKDSPIVARDTSNISNLPENIPVVCSRSDSNSSSDKGSDISELESTSCKEEDSVKTVIALYPFEDDTIENSIGMKTGEEFIITEADDEGWTKVRRKYPVNGINNVGYVPTAYIQEHQ